MQNINTLIAYILILVLAGALAICHARIMRLEQIHDLPPIRAIVR